MLNAFNLSTLQKICIQSSKIGTQHQRERFYPNCDRSFAKFISNEQREQVQQTDDNNDAYEFHFHEFKRNPDV